jgi:APA family basic amino acid/polyamine antiporter
MSVGPTSGRLLRILGAGFGVAVLVGGTIGSGILRTPGAVAAHLGAPWLVVTVWVLVGAYVLLCALSLAELGTMLPRAGGFYVFARRAFGDYPGFAVGWADWFANCAAVAFAGITIGEYAILLEPSLAGRGTLVAASSVAGFTLLQLAGLRVSRRVQEATCALKAALFAALVAGLFLFGGGAGGGASLASAAAPGASLASAVGPGAPAAVAGLLAALVLALQSVLGTYDGWQEPIYFVEEDRDPARNLPRSLIGGVLLVTAIYVGLNLALLYVLPLPALAASPLPVADAAGRLFGGRSGRIITAVSLFSMLSLINAVLLGAPRILFALSRDGFLPARAAFVDRRGTPAVGLLASAAVALVLVASRTFEAIIAIGAFFAVTSYAGGLAALFVLRRREPRLPRPFRVPAYPWTPLVALLGAVAFLAGMVLSDTRISLYALLSLALSGPAYRLMRGRRNPLR